MAALAVVFLFRDTDPIHAVYKLVFEEKTLSDLTVILAATWLTSVVLLLFNHHIYRLLEGYMWPLRRRAWIDRQREKHDDLTGYLLATYPQIFPLPGTATDEVKSEYFRRRQEFNTLFPYKRDLVLATRFGNAIRSFEAYPDKVYGADSIPIWLRLQALIPKDFTAAIGDARVQVDFYLNILVLAVLIGSAALVRLAINLYVIIRCGNNAIDMLSYCSQHDWGRVGFRWDLLIWIVASFALARLCYELAIHRAISWGGLVKSAFDLYLPDLAKQLCYSLPATNARRQEFWSAVNSQFLYAVAVPDEWPRIAPEGAAVQAAADAEPDDDDTG